MSVLDDYIKNGGFWGYTQKLIHHVLDNPADKYHSSVNRVLNSDNNRVQIKEIMIILDDQDHPMNFFIKLFIYCELILEVAKEAKYSSYDQLQSKYKDGQLINIGITLSKINHKKEIDSQNGFFGAIKRHAEEALTKKEAIRLYKKDKRLWSLPATDVETKIYTKLNEFIQKNKFKKKNYTPRVIAEWIRAERKQENKINNTV